MSKNRIIFSSTRNAQEDPLKLDRRRFLVPEEFYAGSLGVYSTTGNTVGEWEIVDPFIQWKTDEVPLETYLARMMHQFSTAATRTYA